MTFLRLTRFYSAVSILSIAAISADAQAHFTFTTKTGNNMPVDIDSSIHPTLDGLPLANGNEIGVFAIDSADTPVVLCVGAVVWRGVNCAITVWGDNYMTAVKDGMHAGERLYYRVWDSALSREVPATVTYASGGPNYNDQTYPVLASFYAPSLPQKPLLASPVNHAAISSTNAVFSWLKGSPFINNYSLEIATDSLFSTIVHHDSLIYDTTSSYSSFTNGTSYWWRVRAHNTSGWGSYSDTFKLTVNSTAVVLPKSCSFHFSGTSNARSSITYSLSSPSLVSIRLYTVQGKFISTLCNAYQSPGYYQLSTGLAARSKGSYILSFTAGNQMTRKIIFNF